MCTRVSRIGLMIAGVTIGWSAWAHARASSGSGTDPAAAVAQRRADAARQRAAELARAGGWAYKTGLVEAAQRDAVRYQAEADRISAEGHGCSAPAALSPAQAAALGRLEALREAGAWAYKTGAVARAERELQVQPTTADDTQAVAPSLAQSVALARLEQLRHAGGWAYKTGAVARAEREVQAGRAVAESTPSCGSRQDRPAALITSSL